MFDRRILLAVLGSGVALVGVTAGTFAITAGAESAGLSDPSVREVVALVDHDQQGVVYAHQAEAQSPAASTRARAAALAARFASQTRVLSALLDARRVPPAARFVDTARLPRIDDDSVSCDLMPKDAVSSLAATAPAGFDLAFTRLMERHLAGGDLMIRRVLDHARLTPAEHRTIGRSQAGLG